MKTVDISGMGGSYEWGCQRMLQLGIEFLKNHPDFSFEGYVNYKNISGIFAKEPPDGKLLDQAIMNDPILTKHGVTGAMHQWVIWHLGFIHNHGFERWIRAAQEHGTETYDFEERYPDSQCPTDKPGGELMT